MSNDWKDALSSLRASLNEPESEDSQSEETVGQNESGQKGRLTVLTDRKGRNGKTATIIEGFTVTQTEVEDIARRLKQKLGVGGSVRNGEILIQGDHKDAVIKFLRALDFKTNN